MSADFTFLQIETAAHGGAFGNNPIPAPTDAQCAAGNYKVGRVSIFGLPIAIEQPRNSYRTGIGADGKRWVSRIAAHYGYINGTKGNDGDCVDCFIGFYPQSQAAFVINQNVGGKFDEHKVCLCFPDEETARRAYLDSYERGWNGLASIIHLSVSQLKWWLRNGNMRRPLSAENLPHEGLETMTRKVQWNSDALPYDQTLDQVLYEIRRSDAGESLLLDAVSAQDIIEDADGALAFDALVTPYAKLERKMEVLQGVMVRSGESVKPVAMQVTEPFKQRGVANVAAIFELSDGQTVSIFFHNPDVTPNKMAASDEVISWKWLLNKKDITIVVAPERGEDLNIREVARRIIRLAEKNSPAFQRANGKRAERMQGIQALKDEISSLESELATAQHDLEVAKVSAEDAQNRKNREHAEAVQRVNETGDAYIRAGENGGIDPKTGKAKEELSALSEAQAAEAQRLKDIANGVPVKEFGFDPTSPEGYAQVTADESLQLKWQDRLDAFFQGRIVDVRNALRALGWEGREPSDTRLYKEGAEVQPTFTHVGAGNNVTGWAMNDVVDDLTKTPEEYAAQVDAAAMSEAANRATKAGAGDTANDPASDAIKLTEQALIGAYYRSFSEAADMLNSAIAAVNWDGIIDTATMNAELDKLHSASRAGQHDLIGKASRELADIGIDTWDERLSSLSDDPGRAAWSSALDANRAASDKIQAIAKEKLIEAGKAELADLPADAPLEDVARAIYRKHGIDMEQRSDWVSRVVTAIKEKSAEALRSILVGVGSNGNKASMEIFERAAGFKLAKTQKERAKQIDEWADITTEKRAEIESAKDAAWQAKERERAVKDAWGWLKSMKVRDGSDIVDGQQYLLNQFNDGYDEAGTSKNGSATIYGMKKGSGLRFVNNRSFNAFLKAAMAFGGLRKSLALVGAEIQDEKIELTGKELGDFPDTPEGLKALREAAVATYRSELETIDGVINAALNKLIAFDGAGRDKIQSFSADARKLHLVAKLKSIVMNGKPTPISPMQPHSKAALNGVKLVHVLKTPVKLDGESIKVRFLVYEKANGSLFYDHSVDNSEAKAAMGGSTEVLDSTDAADLNLPALPSGEPSLEHRCHIIVGNGGQEINEEECLFDESEIGEPCNAEEIALDSASGSGMVFNLFIEGEEPEVVEEEQTPVQKVDATYQFSSATDEFKAWLSDYLDKPEYSPFATAKKMDQAAQRNGASVDWGMFSGAALDGVGASVEALDGAWTDVGKDEIAATKALIGYYRAFLKSDAKFAKVPEMHWADVGWTMDKEEAKRQLRSMIDVAINRKAGIPDLTTKEEDRLRDFAHDAQIISDYMTRRVRQSGRNILRTPEMKAKYPDLDNSPVYDSAATFDAAKDGYVGKVKKDGETVGRIDIGGDGKAMVFVGAAGDQRVVFASGVTAMYSDDDATAMIDALFSAKAAQHTPETNDPAPNEDGQVQLKLLRTKFYPVDIDALIIYDAPEDREKDIAGKWTSNIIGLPGSRLVDTPVYGKKYRVEPAPEVFTANNNVASATDKNAPEISPEDQQKQADQALFQSVIDGSIPDILAPELADSLESAYYRQQTVPALVSLFEQAVSAYQNAMMSATAELA